MRLYVLELKRLLKTRSVGILIIAALILSAVLSYLPVTYIQAYKTDKSGTIQVVTGIEAIKAKKADKKALHGEMTEAKIRETIADIKEVLNKCETFIDLGDKIKLYDRAWIELKSE